MRKAELLVEATRSPGRWNSEKSERKAEVLVTSGRNLPEVLVGGPELLVGGPGLLVGEPEPQEPPLPRQSATVCKCSQRGFHWKAEVASVKRPACEQACKCNQNGVRWKPEGCKHTVTIPRSVEGVKGVGGVENF